MGNNNLENIKNILNDYVTVGAVSNQRSYWDSQLDRVHQLTPRPNTGLTLYRALKLNSLSIAHLESGDPVSLEPAKYTSWSKSKEYAVTFATGKGENAVVVTMDFHPEDITIDISDFYESHDIINDAYWRYVVKEAEVIVKMDKPLVLTSKNCIIVDKMDGYRGPKPERGDYVFSELTTNEDPVATIVAVERQQPDAKRGIFEVEIDDGSYIQVQRIKGVWVEL